MHETSESAWKWGEGATAELVRMERMGTDPIPGHKLQDKGCGGSWGPTIKMGTQHGYHLQASVPMRWQSQACGRHQGRTSGERQGQC